MGSSKIVAESGLPGYAAVNSWGLFAPRGVPQPVVTRLHAEIVRAHALPDLKERYANLGVEATSSTPQQFTDFIKTEAAKFAKALREAGAKVN